MSKSELTQLGNNNIITSVILAGGDHNVVATFLPRCRIWTVTTLLYTLLISQ